MIYFFADNHYGVFPGTELFHALPEDFQRKITFRCDDWTLLESGEWEKDCDLLVLSMIGATCNQPHPGAGAEKAVRAYCERGGNLFLHHGSSAAFWQWDWWRTIVGLRWVRPGDPDRIAPSTHPKKPYRIDVSKTRNPLTAQLKQISLPEDEIYTELEQVTPVTVLMQTKIEEGTFPQAYESRTPWNGKVIGFLPGHKPESFRNPELISDVQVLLDALLQQ